MKKTGNRISIIILVLFVSLSALGQSKRHPVGTIKIATEIPGNLLIDNVPAKEMTIYHQVIITGMDTGSHILSFKYDSLAIQRKILVSPGQTDQYVISQDSVVLNSSTKGRFLRGTKSTLHSYYIPKTKGLYCLATIGYSSNQRHPYFNGMIVGGYQFSPVFSLGAGTGYLQIYSSLDHLEYFLLIAGSSIENSTGFSVPYIPVFIDIRLNLLKKRVVPYFSADIGCSFPVVTKTINGEYDEEFFSIFGDYSYERYHYQIDKINPGFYLAINPGLKVFLQSKYYLDLSMGMDMCFNKFVGTAISTSSTGTNSTINRVKTLSCFHMNVGIGF